MGEYRRNYKRMTEGTENMSTMPVYSTILKHGDATISLLEDYPCTSQSELMDMEIKVNKRYRNTLLTLERAEVAEERRLKNNEQRRAQGVLKITCPCGIVISQSRKSRHVKTLKHIQKMSEKETAILK
jgi:hypothetical protein